MDAVAETRDTLIVALTGVNAITPWREQQKISRDQPRSDDDRNELFKGFHNVCSNQRLATIEATTLHPDVGTSQIKTRCDVVSQPSDQSSHAS